MKLYVAFVDFEKAFDSVSRYKLGMRCREKVLMRKLTARNLCNSKTKSTVRRLEGIF